MKHIVAVLAFLLVASTSVRAEYYYGCYQLFEDPGYCVPLSWKEVGAEWADTRAGNIEVYGAFVGSMINSCLDDITAYNKALVKAKRDLAKMKRKCGARCR